MNNAKVLETLKERTLMYDRKCCRCGMCCLSEVCPAGLVRYGIKAADKKQPCPGLKYEGAQSSCEIAKTWPQLMVGLGIGAGCCIKARVLSPGGVVAFEELEDREKISLADRVRKKLIRNI